MTDADHRQPFLRRVAELAGIRDPAEVERLARAVLPALLEQLPPAERRRLVAALPGVFAETPEVGPQCATDSLKLFYERIASREAVAIGPALEHTQSVCRAIAERLEPDMRSWLVHHLPDAFELLFVLPEPKRAPPNEPVPSHASRHTLSEARPGSHRPLSEAAGGAHDESLARAADPHGDSKLSGTRGLTQERERESLASGRPGTHGSRRDGS